MKTPPISLLALLLVLFSSSFASATVTVFLKDASEMEAQSAWIERGQVLVQVNPELRLTFPAAEVDLERSGLVRHAATSFPLPQKPEYQPAPPKSAKELVDELSEVVGVKRDVDDLFTPGRDDDMDRLVDQHFNPTLAENTVKRQLERRLSVNDLHTVLAWYRTALGKKVLEAQAVVDFNRKEKTGTYAGMATIPKERQDLVRQIEKAEGSSEVEMRLMGNMYRRLVNAIPADFPERKEIQERMQTEVIPSINTLREKRINTLLYSLRDLSTSELRDYLKFLRSPSGRKYSMATLEAVEEIMKNFTSNMEKALRSDFKLLL